MPIALTLYDIAALSILFRTDLALFFMKHCIVYPTLSIRAARDSGYRSPLSIALQFPCTFLEDHRCSIYHSRPLICQIFPYNVHYSHSTKFYSQSEYPCMAPELSMSSEQFQEFQDLAVQRNIHLKQTRDLIPLLAEGITYPQKLVDDFWERTKLVENDSTHIRRSLDREFQKERIDLGMEVARDGVIREMQRLDPDKENFSHPLPVTR